MPTTPIKSRFEGVIVHTKVSSSSDSRTTRSGAKRTGETSSLTTPPPKRVKTAETSRASAGSSSSEAVRVSARSRTTGSVQAPKASGSSKRTPTRIGVPRPGDISGPSTTSRSSVGVSKSTHEASDEDDLAIPVASSSRSHSSRGVAVTSNSIKGKEREAPRNKPPPALLGRRTSSKKKAAISDLMARSVPSSANTRMEQDEEDLRPSRPSSDILSSPKLQEERITDQAGKDASEALDVVSDSEGDPGVSPRGSTRVHSPPSRDGSNTYISAARLPSPAPSTSTLPTVPAPTASLPTPTKKTALPSRLSTPLGSSKKRTPTKAAKPADFLEVPGPLAQIGQNNTSVLPTPSTTPERAPVARIERSHSKKDLLDLFDEVLQRLSGPCANLSLHDPQAPSETDLNYRSWLAGLPFLSPSCETAERDIRNTLDRTIRDGEGNCLLLVGERGIGKTAIVDRSLETLASVYGRDGFLVVRLSGLVQRDDKGALKEVARQLCSNAYADDADAEGGNTFTSNATILSSLLAILEPGSSDEHDKAKPLIFLIDEFDLFAHHSVRQSFLYCLLDCVQGGFRRGGMAVLGLSARADCIETLEKRVKSRCQSRVHHLLPAEDIFTGTVATARQAMTIAGRIASAASEDWDDCVQTFFSDKTVQVQLTAMNELRGLDADRKLFDGLTSLLSDLRYRYCLSRTATSNTAISLRVTDLVPLVQAPDRAIPSDLTVAEVAMLIAAKHIVEEERPFNFVIAYERYTEHSKRAAAVGTSSSRAYSRGLCLKAFEHLRSLGIVKDVSTTSKSGSGGGNLFRLCRLVPWPQMVEDAVKERKDIPQHLVKWCKAWSD